MSTESVLCNEAESGDVDTSNCLLIFDGYVDTILIENTFEIPELLSIPESLEFNNNNVASCSYVKNVSIEKLPESTELNDSSSGDDDSSSDSDSNYNPNDSDKENDSDSDTRDESCNSDNSRNNLQVSTAPHNNDDEGIPMQTEKRKRAKRGRANEDEWNRQLNKKKRELGLEYTGKRKDGTKTITPLREMKPPCNCTMSKAGKKLKCREFNEPERKDIFNQFWRRTWKEKKMIVRCLVNVSSPSNDHKHKNAKASTTRRQNTLNFHLKKNGTSIRVCKIQFLNTLGIKEWALSYWCNSAMNRKSTKLKNNESAAKKKKVLIKAEVKQKSASEFVDSLPKVPSHYCRQSTSRLYIEPVFRSKRHLHREYRQYCAENGKPAAKQTVFNRVLDDKNVTIYKPRKDMCDTCIGHEQGSIPNNIWQEHIEKKNAAQAEKLRDKENAKFVFKLDLESVLLCSRSNANAKLTLHNWTFYNLKTKEVHCFLWDETEADLTANVFASILHYFIITKIPFQPGDEIILYTDGCTYQNRNVTISNSIYHIAKTENITVIQKYLERGNTQMECDSCHASIENIFRHQEVYLPSGYVSACRSARLDNPYKVEYLKHDFFKTFSELSYYSTIRPGVGTGSATVTDLRAIKYTPQGISYKLNHTDLAWSELPQQKKRGSSVKELEDLTPLFPNRRKISKEKWDHLQQLKAVLPDDAHNFYDSIEYEEKVQKKKNTKK